MVAITRTRPGRISATAREIIAGLTAARPFVLPKYFYDALGCILFEAITALPEYYPTRTEQRLLATYANEIAKKLGPGITLIDLGAGNCKKARSLFTALRPVQYVAVDISVEFVQNALTDLKRSFPEIDISGVGADFTAGMTLPPSVRPDKRLFFYPGSSIGNFAPDEARSFLAQIRSQCSPGGGLLIGIDLVKPEPVLHAAYDDALGVTAAFNLNLLNHLNRLIGADFDVRDWRHRALYNAPLARIEMHLDARREVTVNWPDGGRTFAAGVGIHTENSYKYVASEFIELLTTVGFTKVDCWTDSQQWFAVCCAIVQ